MAFVIVKLVMIEIHLDIKISKIKCTLYPLSSGICVQVASGVASSASERPSGDLFLGLDASRIKLHERWRSLHTEAQSHPL